MPLDTPPAAHRARGPNKASQGSGRSLNALAGPLIRALHQVDSACMRALSHSVSPEQQSCARLELAMWLPLHRALGSHLSANPQCDTSHRIDSLLADDLLAFVDDVLLWVADVEAGGERRQARYLSACKQRLGEFEALGGDGRALRTKLDQVVNLAKANMSLALAEYHQQVMQALHKLAPRSVPSLLDGLCVGP